MAILSALALYAVALVPFAIAALRRAWVPRLLALTALTATGISFYQSGLLHKGQLTPTDVGNLLAVDISDRRCRDVIDALIQAGAAAGRPDQAGFIVNGAVWDQLPPTLQQPVLDCASRLAYPDGNSQIELIRR